MKIKILYFDSDLKKDDSVDVEVENVEAANKIAKLLVGGSELQYELLDFRGRVIEVDNAVSH